jgi:hypothetical protein
MKTKVLFSLDGLRTFYSIEIEGERFSTLWSRLLFLEKKVDDPKFDVLINSGPISSQHYELALEDSRNTDELIKLYSEVKFLALAAVGACSDLEFVFATDGPVVPWEMKHLQGAIRAKELILNAIGEIPQAPSYQAQIQKLSEVVSYLHGELVDAGVMRT